MDCRAAVCPGGRAGRHRICWCRRTGGGAPSVGGGAAVLRLVWWGCCSRPGNDEGARSDAPLRGGSSRPCLDDATRRFAVGVTPGRRAYDWRISALDICAALVSASGSAGSRAAGRSSGRPRHRSRGGEERTTSPRSRCASMHRGCRVRDRERDRRRGSAASAPALRASPAQGCATLTGPTVT